MTGSSFQTVGRSMRIPLTKRILRWHLREERLNNKWTLSYGYKKEPYRWLIRIPLTRKWCIDLWENKPVTGWYAVYAKPVIFNNLFYVTLHDSTDR